MTYRCPECGRADFVVEAVVVITWRGGDRCTPVHDMEFRCTEAGIGDECFVVCNGCEWSGNVSALVCAEGSK